MKENQKTFYEKIIESIKNEGITGCTQRSVAYMKKKINANKVRHDEYRDVLFVSGCREDLPHPWRYRVAHQREQMEFCNISTDEIYYQDVSIDLLRYYRFFVFFRCPYTEQIGKFVSIAKKLNKPIIYDVDDLVIDTKYTDLIPYVQQLNEDEKRAYDMNVMNMQRLLKCSDFAITTTNCLAKELKKYVPKVFINRNTASEEMVCLSKKASILKKKETNKVKIGYFSGSITHNTDFFMVLPIILEVLEKYENVELHLVGELDLPEELEKYRSRIVLIPFSDWKKLPFMIADVDINIAPLEDTIFNCAKSENKWVEAALVKVATIASDVGAFHDCIENGVTGILCGSDKEWSIALDKLITDRDYRQSIGIQAYAYCVKNHTTLYQSMRYVHFLKNEIPMNYGFILPGLEISGGMKVALKHASILQEEGRDVILFTLDNKTEWMKYENRIFPVISIKGTVMEGTIGCAIATMWTTLPFVEEYKNIERRCYLVQNYEVDFYEEGNGLRIGANKTYMPHNNIQFLTISKWCKDWLEKKYYQEVSYAPNGLEIERFKYHERNFDNKIRILIEGDCAVSYKNVDEAFKIVENLDDQKFEIWYMSYNAEPKSWYKVDRFLHKVPYEKVPDVYGACHILLKTSLLESFSYPPMEMMATGGLVLAVPNGGNLEYLRDEENCLLYQAGHISQAINQLERLCSNEELRCKLSSNGRKIAEDRAWRMIRKEILVSLYKEQES